MVRRESIPFYKAYQYCWTALDWLYPPVCAGCGSEAGSWCENCRQATTKINEKICQKCGDFVSRGTTCSPCKNDPPAFNALRSFTVFDGVARSALHRLKYSRDISLAASLAPAMIEYLQTLNWQPDIISPIPISKDRYLQRGYNQSAFLAFPIALGLNIRYSSRIIRRVKNTRSQVGLNIQERKQNVAGAFECDSKKIQRQCILLVDDVITTGATMRACAQSLIENGASQVYGLSFARAKYLEDHQQV
ncbi:MAG: ComF family protein [Anaerolineae bacterium]|nr:ComF family protein [Anaerolineae bacterium]